jgi:hypothetical protein
VTKGKGQLPKTSRWYFAGFLFVITLSRYSQCSPPLSRLSKSNKTVNATGDVVQADTSDVNQPKPVTTLNDNANESRPVVTLNDFNEYATNFL